MKKANWIIIVGAFLGMNLSCSNTAVVLDNQINQTNVEMRIIDSTYWTGPEHNGVFLVSKNGLFGLADQNGNLLSEVIYDRIFPFSEGNAIMCRNNFYGVLDAKGKEIAPPIYRSLDDFSNGLCYGASTDFESVLLNLKGENIVPGKNIRISRINGRYVQLENRSLFVFNRQGQKIFSTDFYAFDSYWNKSGKGKYWWFTQEPSHSRQGFQREPDIPQNLPFYFNEGLAVVPEFHENNFKFGYIDTNGKQFIPFMFDDAKCFIQGYACAKILGKWGVIDKQGKWIIQPKYENLENANGRYFIYTEKKAEGVIDLMNNIKISANYLKINYLFDDLFAGLTDNETTRKNAIEYGNGFEPTTGIAFWGCISAQTGDTILPFVFNEILRHGNKIGAGWQYDYVSLGITNDNDWQIPRGQAYEGDYKLTAEGTFFKSVSKSGTYKLPDLTSIKDNNNPMHSARVQITDFELTNTVGDYLYVGGIFLDQNATLITDQALIADLKNIMNGGKPNIHHDQIYSLFGATSADGDTILPTTFEELNLVKTGLIAKKNGLYGFYDFKGTLIIPHVYTNMSELPTGILQVQKNNDSHQEVLLNKIGEELTNY